MGSESQFVTGGGAAEQRLRVTELPSWVTHGPFEAGGETDEKFVNNGTCLLLRDHQIDCTGSVTAMHARMIWRILTPAGAAAVAQFSLAFDPLLQHLDVHHIRVYRDGAVLDHARRESFTLMRREQNLERHVLDGHVTASCIVPDVRPGDVVENCWTIYEENPVRGGHISVFAPFLAPSMEIRERLRLPAGRTVAIKYFGEPLEPSVNEHDGIVEYRWTAHHNEPKKAEDYTPPWVITARWLQASDIADWPQASRLFAAHYEPKEIPAPIAAEAQRIAAAYSEPETRIMAVLQAVQTRLRYLSMSLGAGGLVPRPLAEIWESGYGDCKDSSVLFVALARLCGIEAVPALVATTRGKALRDFLPNTEMFDHCIVRATIAGRRYWIDPTRRYQPYKLALLNRDLLGFALPVTPEGGDLEDMGIPDSRIIRDVREAITYGTAIASPAAFSVRMTFGGLAAESMRELLANQGQPAMAEQLRNRYVNEWPRITYSEPMTVENDDDDGSLTLTGRFTIAKPWADADGNRVISRIADRVIAGELGNLARTDGRENDLWLGVPRVIRRRVDVTMPKEWNVENAKKSVQIEGASYSEEIVKLDPSKFAIEQQLVISAPVAPSTEASGYASLTRNMNDQPVFVVTSPAWAGTFGSKPNREESRSQKIIKWIGFIVFMIGWVLFHFFTQDPDPQQPISAYREDRLNPDAAPPPSTTEQSAAKPQPGSDLHVKNLDWINQQTDKPSASDEPTKKAK